MDGFGQLHDVGFVESLRDADGDRATLVARFFGDDLMRRKTDGLIGGSQRYVSAGGRNYSEQDEENSQHSGPKIGAHHARGK